MAAEHRRRPRPDTARSATGTPAAAVDAAAATFADAVEAYSALEEAGASFEAAEQLGRADRSISDAAWAAGIGANGTRRAT